LSNFTKWDKPDAHTEDFNRVPALFLRYETCHGMAVCGSYERNALCPICFHHYFKNCKYEENFFVALAFMTVHFAFAQKPVKDHYTVSGGLLGAANYSKFNVSGNSNVKYDYKFGWGAGGWLNIPLGHTLSLEPQVLYNSLGYKSDQTVFLADGSGQYISVPVLLKLGLGKNFAITAGPQFDFLMGIKDKDNNNIKEDFTGTSISGNVGLEVFPHARVTPFARYIFGFSIWIIQTIRM
jgi:hypothetical protein